MKRYLVTNPNFTGAVELIYLQNGLLQKIDFSNCSMTEIQLHYFKEKAPSNVNTEKVADVFSKATTVIMADVAITFDMFWVGYNKKINKLRCIPLWEKMPQAEQVQAYCHIAVYDKFLKKENRIKADPENYLRSKYYQNEY